MENDFPQELTQLLRRNLPHRSEAVAYRFIGLDAEPRQEMTYGELDRRAKRLAAELTARQLTDKRVLLAYDPGLDFVVAFVAAIYAGVTAVPAYPPDPFRLHRTLERLQKIVDDAQAAAILTTSHLVPLLGGVSRGSGSAPIFATDQLDIGTVDEEYDWELPNIAANRLALLQYTSGSTDDPKGVMVTRDNLVCNLEQIHRRVDRPEAVTASWLPVYHDMGLLAGVLQPLQSGRVSILMSPLAFFQQPLRCLQVISDFKVTAAVSPDFGYDVCVRKTTPSDRAQLDLRHWQIAMNGSEPVRAATMERFLAAFRGSGIRENIFLPCYGLAEATLFVAGGNPEDRPYIASFDADRISRGKAVACESTTARARQLVASGPSVSQQILRIVNVDTLAPESDGTVGEIWVAGRHVAAGYWRREELSQATFHAYTSEGQGPFLRTGDTGFIHAGQLFVTGRIKDMIIVAGRNHYPQDIERTVEQCDTALKPHGGAVFSVDDGEMERVVIVHEVLRPKQVDQRKLLEKITAAVVAEHQVVADAIVLIKSGTLPKTTSGKTRRSKCRDLYLKKRLAVVVDWRTDRRRLDSNQLDQQYVAPRTSTEELLVAVWSEVLGVERVGIHDNFLDLGGQSLLASQVAARMAKWVSPEAALGALFDHPTIAELAAWIDSQPLACDNPAEFDELLRHIDSLSEDEVHALLRHDSPMHISMTAVRT